MDAQTFRDLAQRRYDEFLEELAWMVNVDCGSWSPDGVNRIADRCQRRFEEHGWEVERRAHDGEPRLGDLLIGRLRGSGGPDVLLIGHMDTVFDDGTAAERPFRVDGDRARGPGVSDMKAGLLAGFFATHVLQDAEFDGFGSITYVCNPDEEIGSPFSGPVIRELAPRHDAAFVLEGGRENGDIVSARKGVTDYTIRIRGRAAHAGVEPERGRNAILQGAQTIVALQALNGRWPGVTVNVGVVQGGTRSNVVAERCDLHVDLRSPELATLEEAEAEVLRVCGEPTVPDVTIDVETNSWHRPMEKRAEAQRLVDVAVAAARPTPTRRAPLGRRRSTVSARSAATTTAPPSGWTSRASCPGPRSSRR